MGLHWCLDLGLLTFWEENKRNENVFKVIVLWAFFLFLGCGGRMKSAWEGCGGLSGVGLFVCGFREKGFSVSKWEGLLLRAVWHSRQLLRQTT